MFNLILFGPPGSGKGTQSEKLITKYGLKHLSTGDLLRSEIAAKTPLGIEAKSIMDKGHLVPDEVVIGMISSALEANPDAKGFYLMAFLAQVHRQKHWINYSTLKNSHCCHDCHECRRRRID
jgi:adenylate kinase